MTSQNTSRPQALRPLSHGTIGWVLFFAFSAIYLGLTVFANRDFTQGRFCIHMDELLTLDGVKDILHAPNKKAFLNAVTEGNTHCYGRILWNISAIFSFIPEKIGGLQGQLIATRSLHALFLLASYWILIFTFIRSPVLRAIALLALFAIPSTPYYATLPKPEPLQLFWMACFFYWAVKKNYAFSWHWIFLGFAVGTKISALPWIAVLGLVSLSRANISSLLKAAGAFLTGFFISEPWTLAHGLKGFPVWFHWAMLNATHDSDDITTTWKSWINHMLHHWTGLPAPLMLAIGLLAGLLIFMVLWNFSKKELSEWHVGPSKGLVPILLGCVHLVLIIFVVKRLWDFYLHPAMVFLIVGFISLAEVQLLPNGRENRRTRLTFWIAIFLTVGIIFSSVFGSAQNIARLILLGRRSQTDTFKTKYQEYQFVVKALDTISNSLGRPFSVFYDPKIYVPDSNAKYKIQNFPGYFLYWFSGWDFVILSHQLTPQGAPPSPTSVENQEYPLALQTFDQHVGPDGLCKMAPCYMEIPWESSSIHLYARQDLAPLVKAKFLSIFQQKK
ncbi:MAG: hypothetical protein HYZ84_07030 [Candidatus Omnitrophica bacterium]|nr:hypothetical protein [Candidatus Omnitrophota bacterium]